MDERGQLIETLDDARTEMRAALEVVDRSQEVSGRWTIKEVLAHITGWDSVTLASLRALAAGDTPRRSISGGIDAYNAQIAAECEGLGFEQVLERWELAREQLKAAVGDVPGDRLTERFVFPWGAHGTIADMLMVLAAHEEEHAEETRAR